MKKTSTNTWFHDGWDIEYWGDGYRLTRREPVNGKTVTTTAASLAKARVIISNAELEIKCLGRLPKHRK